MAILFFWCVWVWSGGFCLERSTPSIQCNDSPAVGDGRIQFRKSNKVSSIELSELFGLHQVPGRELSEIVSAYRLCYFELPMFSFAELGQFGAELSESLSSVKTASLKTLFRPFLSVSWHH